MRKAFTLIELIATIVILGVVTSIVSILIMNIIRNAKNSANKRSIDNYGRIVETSMVEYQSQYLKYPDSIDQLEIEYVGSVIECETRRINPDKTIYLSECKVNGKKVLDKNTEDGYYHYGILVLTNEEYVDKLGNNIELALKDYYKENNKYPVNYRLLNIPKLDKDVNCVSHINPDGTVYLTKCSIDGSYILNENEEDGYYHYGNKSIYDYVDNEGNGYTKVEYLDSTGEQYIDTGFKPNQDTKAEMDFTVFANQTEFYFGARKGNADNSYTFLQVAGQFRSDYAQNNNKNTGNINNITNYPRFTVIKDKNITTINNSVTLSDSYSNFQSDYNIYIFAVNHQNNPTLFSRMRLYSFKLYDDNLLVRDYVPAMDINYELCLFDKVNKKCYYNAGTRKFVNEQSFVCPDIDNYTKINYIESTGTQFIDTNFKPNQDTKVEIDFTVLASQTEFYFGARKGNANNTYSFLQFGNKFRSDYSQSNGESTGNINNITSYPRFRVIKDKNITTINNSVTSSCTYGAFQSNYNMYIFAVNQEDNPKNYSMIKLYEFKIYDNNVIIKKLIPMLDKEGNACLYDMVECKCYYNQGTGEFLYG